MIKSGEKLLGPDENPEGKMDETASRPISSDLIQYEAEFMSIYKKDKWLGKGSFGEVYRWAKKEVCDSGENNKHAHFPRSVAVKQFDLATSNQEVDIFVELHHENVVVIVMELCKGTLSDLIKSKTLRDYELSRLMKQVVQGIEYIHARGIIHRDIKPDNFLLSVSGEANSCDWKGISTHKMTVKLADFGCGRKIQGNDSQRNVASIVGNDGYWPPEVRRGKLENLDMVCYSRKSDIWSLGVMAYKCSTGNVPGFKNGLIQYSHIEKTNKQLHDFLKDIFIEDLDRRPTARDLLGHLFLQNVDPHKDDFVPCIQTDDQDYLRHLLAHLNVNALHFEIGRHPLDIAVSCDQLKCLQILIEEGKANIDEGEKLLVTSVAQDFITIAEYLLTRTKINKNEVDIFGNTGLNLACQRRNESMIKLFCKQNNIDANKPNKDGHTTLHEAAKNCYLPIFEHIFKNTNADLSCIDSNGRTMVMFASAIGKLDIIQYITKHSSVNINHQDSEGLTALHNACSYDWFDVVEYLITKASADVTLYDRNGWTVLHHASNNSRRKVAEYLLSNKILDPSTQTKPEKMTPLHIACQKDSLEIAKCLIGHLADVEAKDMYKRSPIFYACRFNSPKIARYLVEEKSAQVNISDESWFTPLHAACEAGDIDIVKLLVENQANVTARTKHLHQPLHVASIHGNYNIVRYFLENKDLSIDVLARDHNGDTILHLACRHIHQKIAKYILMKQLICVNGVNNHGETPLHLTCQQGYAQIVKLLLTKTDTGATNQSGNTAFAVAEMYGNKDIITILNKFSKKKRSRIKHEALHTSLNTEVLQYENSDPTLVLKDLHRACEEGNDVLVNDILMKSTLDACKTLNDSGLNAIHIASMYGKVSVLKVMIERGLTSLNEKDEISQYTPLHHAVKHANLDFVDFLLETGQVDIDAQASDGTTPLHLACKLGLVNVVKCILKCGADVYKMMTDENRWGSIQVATVHGKVKVIQYLCEEQNELLETLDTKGRSLLHLACQYNSLESTKYIFNRKPEFVHSIDYDGHLPIHYLADNDAKLEILRYFIDDCACDPTIFNGKGQNILHIASKNNCIHILSFLIHERKIDRKVRDEDGMLDILIATCEGNIDILSHLIERESVDVNVVSSDGMAPLHLACREGHVDMVEYLTNIASINMFLKDKDGSSCLHFAAWKGHLEIVKMLAGKYHADANCTMNNGLTPLHLACQGGYLDVVEYLYSKANANRFLTDEFFWCDLHFASWKGHLEIMKYCVEVGHADVNVVTSDGMTPYHISCIDGRLEVVKYFLNETKADRTLQDEQGFVDIHFAVIKGHLETLKFLLEEILVDVDTTTNTGMTCLHLACRDGHLEIVKYLLEETKVNRLLVDEYDQMDIHMAAWQGNLKIVKYLVEQHGADANVCEYDGQTPLHLAYSLGHVDMVNFLLTIAKANINARSKSGGQGIHYAAQNGHFELVKYLVENHSVDANVTTIGGTTPLHLACRSNHLDVVDFLLNDAKANRLLGDEDGNLDIHFATLKGHIELVKYLVEQHSADINTSRNNGMTPLHMACRDDNLTLVEYLLKEAHADKMSKDSDNWLGVHFAAAEGNLDIVKYLIEEHAIDYNVVTTDKKTPLHLAQRKNHIDVEDYLQQFCQKV